MPQYTREQIESELRRRGEWPSLDLKPQPLPQRQYTKEQIETELGRRDELAVVEEQKSLDKPIEQRSLSDLINIKIPEVEKTGLWPQFLAIKKIRDSPEFDKLSFEEKEPFLNLFYMLDTAVLKQIFRQAEEKVVLGMTIEDWEKTHKKRITQRDIRGLTRLQRLKAPGWGKFKAAGEEILQVIYALWEPTAGRIVRTVEAIAAGQPEKIGEAVAPEAYGKQLPSVLTERTRNIPVSVMPSFVDSVRRVTKDDMTIAPEIIGTGLYFVVEPFIVGKLFARVGRGVGIKTLQSLKDAGRLTLKTGAAELLKESRRLRQRFPQLISALEKMDKPIGLTVRPIKPTISKELELLAEEARKYKTVKDFETAHSYLMKAEGKSQLEMMGKAGFVRQTKFGPQPDFEAFYKASKEIKPLPKTRLPDGGVRFIKPVPEVPKPPEIPPMTSARALEEVKRLFGKPLALPEARLGRVEYWREFYGLTKSERRRFGRLYGVSEREILAKEAVIEADKAKALLTKTEATERIKQVPPAERTSEQITVLEANIPEAIKTPELPAIGSSKPPRTPLPGEILFNEPSDIGRIQGQLARSIEPIREVARQHPVAGHIARMGRNTMLEFRHELTTVNRLIEDTYAGIKTVAQKEELTRLIQANIPKAKINDYPQLSKALWGKRALNQKAIDLAESMGVDTTGWRFTPADYMHHLFLGSQKIYKVVGVRKGQEITKTLGFSRTRHQALKVAEDLLKKDATLNIVIEPKFSRANFSATMLSRKGFWRFIDAIADVLKTDKASLLEELNLKGVAAIKPRPKFVGAFKVRVANLGGYVEDPEFVDKILWNRMLRKKHFEPFQKRATTLAERLPQNIRMEMEEYIQTISGKYYPYGLQGLTNAISRWQTYFKLGYRPVAALVNRLQTLQTLFPEVTVKNLVRGYFAKFTKRGKSLVKELKTVETPAKYYGGERVAPMGERMYHPMGMFSFAEKGTRRDATLAGYFEMLDRLKKQPRLFDAINTSLRENRLPVFTSSEELAKQFAKDLNAGTMFLYDISDLGRWFRSDVVQATIGKFRPFTINYLYNTKNILLGKPLGGTELYYPIGYELSVQQKITRAIKFLGGNAFLGGLKVITFGVERALPMGYLTYLFIEHPIIARGITGWLGVDLSRNIGVEPFELIPEDGWDLLGVVGADIKTVREAIREKDPALLLRTAPAAYRVYQVLKMDDYLRSSYRRDRPQVPMDDFEKVLWAVGFTPLKVGIERDIQRYISIQQRRYKKHRAEYIDLIIDAFQKRNTDRAIGLIKEAESDGIIIKPQDVLREWQQKKQPALLRRLKTVPGPLRKEMAQIIRKYPETIAPRRKYTREQIEEELRRRGELKK